MPQRAVARNAFQDDVFQIARIGKIEAFIDAEGQDRRVRFDFEPMDVAEMLGPRHPADLGDVRPAGAEQEQQQRQSGADHQSAFHAFNQHADDGRGLAPADLNKPKSFGLRGIRERVAHLNGWKILSRFFRNIF